MKTAVIKVEGMSCGHCVSAVEGALTKLDSVSSAKVSLEENNVTVEYNETNVDLETLKNEIEEQGYDVV
jgi:copper chaperone